MLGASVFTDASCVFLAPAPVLAAISVVVAVKTKFRSSAPRPIAASAQRRSTNNSQQPDEPASASHGCAQASIMKFSHVATALLLVTALVTVTNLLHLPHHAAPAGDKDAALRAEIDALAAAAKAGEAFAREPPLTPKPPAAVPAPPAPIVKPPPPKNDFAGTTVAIVKPNLYDHGHTFGEFKIFAAIMWGAQELGASTVVVKNRAEAAALKGNIIVVPDQYTDDALKRAVSTKRRYNVGFLGHASTTSRARDEGIRVPRALPVSLRQHDDRVPGRR